MTSPSKSALYVYNAENSLVRATVQSGNNVSVEEYKYDYAGNRIAKSSEGEYTKYLLDVNGELTYVLAEMILTTRKSVTIPVAMSLFLRNVTVKSLTMSMTDTVLYVRLLTKAVRLRISMSMTHSATLLAVLAVQRMTSFSVANSLTL